jgi:hypothetical protein
VAAVRGGVNQRDEMADHAQFIAAIVLFEHGLFEKPMPGLAGIVR